MESYEHLDYSEIREIDTILDELDENEDVQRNLIEIAGRGRIISYLQDTLLDMKDDKDDELYQAIETLIGNLQYEADKRKK